MESDTTEFDRDLQMLHELAARNRHAQVRQVLARLAAQEPDHHDVLYHSAQVDWLEDRDEAALATASRLAELYPQSYWGRLLLVKIQGSLGKLGVCDPTIGLGDSLGQIVRERTVVMPPDGCICCCLIR